MGIGKYSGEMVQWLVAQGHDVVVVTTPPYYPQWRIWDGFSGARYETQLLAASGEKLEFKMLVASGEKLERQRLEEGDSQLATSHSGLKNSHSELKTSHSQLATSNSFFVLRCPLWVPAKVSGLKRVLHLASFGLSSIPVMMWQAIRFRPDVVMTVEPAAFCMPTTWVAARIAGAKCWLHVQDFEVDAAFDLGILQSKWARRLVLAVEAFLMRRFDRVSSISPNMILKLVGKGVDERRVVSLPNWVDGDAVRPLWPPMAGGEDGDAASVRESFGIPPAPAVAMYAGNISVKQGVEIILAAAALAAGGTSDLHFVICGDGASAGPVRDAAARMANVTFLPPQPFERLNELLNCADVHLLPQKSGAADLVMPSKLTGMMASGRPTVAGATPGTQIADVVSGRGKVVPPDDASAMHQAIVGLVGDADRCRQMGDAARQFAVEHLGRDSILRRLESDLRALSRRP